MLERNTKYTDALRVFIARQGHATNAAILTELQKTFPDLSATTVHRITSRMVMRSELATAPVTRDNSARFDATITPHDHFHCTNCDCLRDIPLSLAIRQQIQDQLGDCELSGPLTISGICTNCKMKEQTT